MFHDVGEGPVETAQYNTTEGEVVIPNIATEGFVKLNAGAAWCQMVSDGVSLVSDRGLRQS